MSVHAFPPPRRQIPLTAQAECAAMIDSCGGNPMLLAAIVPMCMAAIHAEAQSLEVDRKRREHEAQMASIYAEYQAKFPPLTFPEISG